MKNSLFQKIIESAKDDKDVLAVALFGSSLMRKGRDIDLCLFLDKKHSNLEMSKIRMRYLGKFPDFDIHIFQQLPLYLRMRIFKKMKVLLVKDLDLLYSISFSTIKDFGFYSKAYHLYLEGLKNG